MLFKNISFLSKGQGEGKREKVHKTHRQVPKILLEGFEYHTPSSVFLVPNPLGHIKDGEKCHRNTAGVKEAVTLKTNNKPAPAATVGLGLPNSGIPAGDILALGQEGKSWSCSRPLMASPNQHQFFKGRDTGSCY